MKRAKNIEAFFAADKKLKLTDVENVRDFIEMMEDKLGQLSKGNMGVHEAAFNGHYGSGIEGYLIRYPEVASFSDLYCFFVLGIKLLVLLRFCPRNQGMPSEWVSDSFSQTRFKKSAVWKIFEFRREKKSKGVLGEFLRLQRTFSTIFSESPPPSLWVPKVLGP